MVELPSTMKQLGKMSFYSCEKLTSIVMDDSLDSIGEQAFEGCKSLLLNKLPDNLTYIGSEAFRNCSKITIASIPNGVELILSYTFRGCTELRITEFGSNDNSSKLSGINQDAFYNAGNGTKAIEEIIIYNSVNSIAKNAFDFYARNTLKTVNFAKTLNDYNVISASELGFKQTDLTVVENYTP